MNTTQHTPPTTQSWEVVQQSGNYFFLRTTVNGKLVSLYHRNGHVRLFKTAEEAQRFLDETAVIARPVSTKGE